MSEQTAAEEIEVTDTIVVTEVTTDRPEPTAKENEESWTTPPGSPQRENPEVQNNSEDTTDANAEQAVKKDTQNTPKQTIPL